MNSKYDKSIDQYIPEGVALTDVQQGYLTAIVELFKKQKTVKMIDVAHHLNKSTGAVSSAMKTLSSKGILATNPDGEIMLLPPQASEKSSTKASAKKAAPKQAKTKESNQRSGDSQKKEPRVFVTANELIDSCSMSKFKGIHEVNDGSEWISCNGFWAINVPAGFSYTMDTTKTGKSAHGGKCDLEIQLTSNADFKTALRTPFSLAVYSEALMVPLADNSDDLCSTGMKKSVWALKQLFRSGNFEFETAVYSSDVAVIYLTQRDSSIKEDHLKITFFVICSGSGLVSYGDAVISGKQIDELLPVFTEMLMTIKKIPQDRSFTSFYSPALPSGYSLKFSQCESLTAANGDRIPVPDGYKWSTDQSVINTRSFSIVPNDASFWNGVGDQSKTRIDLSGMMFEIGGVKQADGMFATIAQHIATQLPENVMESNVALHLVKLTSEGGIFIQQNADKDNMTNIMIRALKITTNDAKLYTVRIYFPKKIPANMVNKTVIECRRFASCWFSRFMYTSDLCDYGYIPTQPIIGAPEELYEHYELIKSGSYSTHRSADFIGQSIKKLMTKTGNTKSDVFSQMNIDNDQYDLDKKALTIAQVFRMKEHKFDPYHDTEAFIQRGMIEKVEYIHKLRSFAWTWAAEAENDKRDLTDTEDFMSFQYSEFDFRKGNKDRIILDYNDKKYFTALCNQYDWHVFYVPDSYLNGEQRKKNDLRVLCGKENRGGNTISFAITGLGVDNLDEMQRNNAIISRNEETLASLESLRKDLLNLLPIMEKIHDEFLENRNRAKPLTGYLAEVLAAWCALCVAAKDPFYSEEAADTPEADAALDGPMERPTSPLNTKYFGQEGAPDNQPKEVHLDLHGATVVEEDQFRYSSSREWGDILILPEGLVEIKTRGFMDAPYKEVRLPKTLRIIGSVAFYNNKNLETIVIPEGVTEIGAGALGGQNEITDIYLPDSLRKLDRTAFHDGTGDKFSSSKIKVHLSGKCAKGLTIENVYQQYGPSHTVAKVFVIDGKEYKTIEDYRSELEKEDRLRRERQRQEEERKKKQQDEEKKAAQRESLRKEISKLTEEMNAIKGLFSGMKKKKIQKQIDELQDRIKRI